MPREAQIQKSIVEWINSQPNALARVHHGSSYTVKGDPDIYGCINGYSFVIECKQPGKEPAPIQWRRLREWQGGLAVTGVAHSLEEAQQLLEPLLNAPPAPWVEVVAQQPEVN